MTSHQLLPWFIRDLNKLKEEILSYKNEADLWLVKGEIKNSPGTLALHTAGSIKHFIGAMLGDTGYIRHREKEFSERNIPKEILVREISEALVVVEKVFLSLTPEKLSSDYPVEFIGGKRSVGEAIFILYGHLNYHLGQINYHRRMLAAQG